MATGRAASIQRNSERRARNVASKSSSASAPSSSSTTVTTAPSTEPVVSGSLKDLSIGLANQPGGGASGSGGGSGSLKDLSIGLAQGNAITQDDIADAQSGGASLASRTAAPASGGSTAPGSTAPASSPQTGVGGEDGGSYYSRYTREEDEEPVVEDVNLEDIQKKMTRDAQKEINSLYKYEKSLLEEQAGINAKDERSTASINTLTGLAGSTEANINQQQTTDKGKQANQLIRDQVQVKVQGILSNIRKDALEQYKFEKSESRLDAAEAREAAASRRENATNNITLLAQTGATSDGYKTTDPEGYAYLAKQVGGEDILNAMFTLNRPQDTILDKKVEGGKYVIAFQNPLDGKIRIETVDLGLPPQYSKTVDAGNRILAIPDNWDGDPSSLITINKGLTPGQSAAGSGGDMYGGYNDDQNKVITRVDDKVSKNDTYKKTNNMRGYVDNVTNALALGTGTGDLAAINQFQKVIDEGAVTRDQDVKLIQASQSLVNKLQTKVKGLEEGDQLSPELRTEMAAAVTALYGAQVKALSKDPFIQSKKSELERYGVDPNDTIIGELGAFSGGGQQLQGPDGQLYDASDLTNEEYQEALANGYTEA